MHLCLSDAKKSYLPTYSMPTYLTSGENVSLTPKGQCWMCARRGVNSSGSITPLFLDCSPYKNRLHRLYNAFVALSMGVVLISTASKSRSRFGWKGQEWREVILQFLERADVSALYAYLV